MANKQNRHDKHHKTNTWFVVTKAKLTKQNSRLWTCQRWCMSLLVRPHTRKPVTCGDEKISCFSAMFHVCSLLSIMFHIFAKQKKKENSARSYSLLPFLNTQLQTHIETQTHERTQANNRIPHEEEGPPHTCSPESQRRARNPETISTLISTYFMTWVFRREKNMSIRGAIFHTEPLARCSPIIFLHFPHNE